MPPGSVKSERRGCRTNPMYKGSCRIYHTAGNASELGSHEESPRKFILAFPTLNVRMRIPDHLPGIQKENVPKMARPTAREANPLYPVPVLMNAKKPEVFYEKAADWS